MIEIWNGNTKRKVLSVKALRNIKVINLLHFMLYYLSKLVDG